MRTIPDENKRYIQTNESDTLGNIYATKNCDFDSNRGVLQLGKRMILNTGTDDVPEITSYPVGFKYFANAYWTVAGLSSVGYPFKASSLVANFSKVVNGGGISGLPTTFDSLYSDIEIMAFGTSVELTITNASEAKFYYSADGLTWTGVIAGAAGSAMMLCFYGGRGYVTKNGFQIQSWDSSHTVTTPSSTTSNTYQYCVNIPDPSLVITWIRSSSRGIFIGTVNKNGGKGYVYFWDGVSSQVSVQYRMKSAGALAAIIENDVPLIVDSNGSLLDWNGGTFSILDGIYRKSNKPLFNPYYSSNQRFIHPNGIAIIKDKPHLLLDLTNYDAGSHGGTQEDCNPSGIWVYDKDSNSLRHKYSFGLTKSNQSIVDYGAFRIFGAGGIADILTAQSPVTDNGTFLAGCSYYSDATTTKSGIFYDDNNDTLAKAGYYISTKMSVGSKSITDTWNKLVAFHEKFLNATDKITVKYRTVESTPKEGTITWISETAFTTALDLSTFAIGDEVEILQGKGAGFISHISNIQSANTGYIVNIEDTITGVTGTSRARIDKWKKAGVIQDTEDFDEVPINDASTWLQIKPYMFWSGRNELSEVSVINTESKKIE